MTRLPRDLSGDELIRALARYGYAVTRQTGSHARLTTLQGAEHHTTVPRHNALRPGTISAILTDVAGHLARSKDAVVEELFGR